MNRGSAGCRRVRGSQHHVGIARPISRAARTPRATAPPPARGASVHRQPYRSHRRRTIARPEARALADRVLRRGSRARTAGRLPSRRCRGRCPRRRRASSSTRTTSRCPSCVYLNALPIRLPSATASTDAGAATRGVAVLLDVHLDRLVAELRAMRLDHLVDDLRRRRWSRPRSAPGARRATAAAAPRSARSTGARRARCGARARACCLGRSSCASSSSVAPRITDSGVRSSWLTSALNSRSRSTSSVRRRA